MGIAPDVRGQTGPALRNIASALADVRRTLIDPRMKVEIEVTVRRHQQVMHPGAQYVSMEPRRSAWLCSERFSVYRCLR